MKKKIIIFSILIVLAGLLYACKDAVMTAVNLSKPVNKEFSKEIQENIDKKEPVNGYELFEEQEKKEITFTENQLNKTLDMKSLDEIIKTARKDNKEELKKMHKAMKAKEEENIAAQKEIVIRSDNKKNRRKYR